MDRPKLLYGDGETGNIVATEVLQDKPNTIQVFYRKDDEVTSEYKTYTPFIYLNDQDEVLNSLYDDAKVETLMGKNFYNTMVKGSSVYYVKKNSDKAYMPFSQSQWMLTTGETQFMDMDFDGPLRLYVDIETLTKEGYEFPNSSRPEDKISIISMLDNRGNSWILALNDDGKTPKGDNIYRCETEKALIEKFVTSIRKIDPDIIVGHHFFGFDLPYIKDRAQMHDVKLKLGRNGATPYEFSTSIKFAEKSDDYTNVNIYGRHVLDTYFMAKQFDMVARKLDGYGLKYCAKFLGVSPENRTYIEGDQINRMWYEDRKALLDYALDDVIETQGLDQAWGNAIFESTKLLPLPMQDVARYGTGNKFDLLMERQYYKYAWSLPRPSERKDYGGGYAASFAYGIITEPTIYMDVSSLYPTLRELLDVTPAKDELGVYSELCDLLKEFRYKAKYGAIEAKKRGDAYQREIDELKKSG